MSADRNAWWALALLSATYVLNFIDRTILSTLGEPIKLALGLSDGELGLLGGLPFALTYSVLGLPAALYSERYSRRKLVFAAVLLWSAMTMSCGVAAGFVSLLILRAGVGVGEAGFTAPAHAMISDLFAPAKRPLALSIFNAAIPVGVLVGAAAGGWLAHTYGWRVAFFAIGLPGILIAPLYLWPMREPGRGASETIRVAPQTVVRPTLRAVALRLARRPSARHLIVGGALASCAVYAVYAFTVSYFIRRHGLSLSAAATVFGVAVAGAQLCGMLAGGAITGRAAIVASPWLLRVPALALAIGAVLLLFAWHQQDLVTSALLLALGMAFAGSYTGPYFTALHGLLTPYDRATGIAIIVLIQALVGIGLGPPLVGAISDHLTVYAFAGDFHEACAALDATLRQPACREAGAVGLQRALELLAGLFGLTAVSFHLASRTYLADAAASGR